MEPGRATHVLSRTVVLGRADRYAAGWTDGFTQLSMYRSRSQRAGPRPRPAMGQWRMDILLNGAPASFPGRARPSPPCSPRPGSGERRVAVRSQRQRSCPRSAHAGPCDCAKAIASKSCMRWAVAEAARDSPHRGHHVAMNQDTRTRRTPDRAHFRSHRQNLSLPPAHRHRQVQGSRRNPPRDRSRRARKSSPSRSAARTSARTRASRTCSTCCRPTATRSCPTPPAATPPTMRCAPAASRANCSTATSWSSSKCSATSRRCFPDVVQTLAAAETPGRRRLRRHGLHLRRSDPAPSAWRKSAASR